MPTYAYACQSCGHSFEIRQSFSDDALTVCPECSGQLRKLFNNVGIVFKGSGFYRNDSRSTTSSTEKSSTDKSSEKSSSEKSSTGSGGSASESSGSSTPSPSTPSSSSSTSGGSTSAA